MAETPLNDAEIAARKGAGLRIGMHLKKMELTLEMEGLHKDHIKSLTEQVQGLRDELIKLKIIDS